MKNLVLIAVVLLVAVSAASADLLECNEHKLPGLADIPIIGPKVTSKEDSSEHQVRDFFKDLGCKIQRGAKKLAEKTKELGSDIKDGAKKLGTDIKTKFDDLKDRLSHDSSEERMPHRLVENFEIVNPDILKSEEKCGHGHILDALGNCSKLRK